MPSNSREERRKLRKTKNLFNRAIDIFITGILGTIVLYIWFMLGTNLMVNLKNLNSLPSNINQAPYCCKGSKGTETWKYGFPYNLGDNPTIIPFIPCAVKMIGFNWLRTLFYVKYWLAGTLKQSWSISRGFLGGLSHHIPNTSKTQVGGGRLGNAWSYVKGKGSNVAGYVKGKGSNVAGYVKGKASNVASYVKGKSPNWSFMELIYFIFAPAFGIALILLAIPVSILVTFYGSFKTSLFWSIFGILFVMILAAVNSIVQFGHLTGLLFFKGMKMATLKEVTKNFLKYGRGPFIMGALLLILKKFPEIPFYLRIGLFILTPILLFFF